jgi:predicted RND superfamily exporter protein
MGEVERASVKQLQIMGPGLAALMGVAALVGGIAAFAKDMPPVMAMTMVVLGLLLPWLTWKSLHHSRAAWSFLVATVAVFGVVCLFGAPKIRHLLGIDLGFALVIPAIQAACVIALAKLSGEYRE